MKFKMSATAVRKIDGGWPGAAGVSTEPRWYAAYTCANHEKKVAEQLRWRGVEHFLPLYETVRRWSDRRVRLQLPLFPGYVFVRVALRDQLRVLEAPSVACLVGFGQRPAALPESEIDTLRKGLNPEAGVLPHPYLTVGRRVRIRSGPLAGMEGILQRRKANYRVVIGIDLIMKAIAVEMDAGELEIMALGKAEAASLPRAERGLVQTP